MLGWHSKKPGPPRTPKGFRAYAVGDVHGRLDLLDALLGQIEADVASRPGPRNLLIMLGDLFESSGSTLVVGGGMSPGLSGLMARHLVDQLATADEIHVAIHGTAGPACARSHHRSLSRRSPGWPRISRSPSSG